MHRCARKQTYFFKLSGQVGCDTAGLSNKKIACSPTELHAIRLKMQHQYVQALPFQAIRQVKELKLNHTRKINT